MTHPLAAAALAIAACAQGQVALRGGERIDAEVVAVNAEGVWTASDASRLLTWDIVRSVEGPLRAEAELFADVADDAWRARTRLERGDTVLAEPLFQRVYNRCADAGGATALLAAEGLLRCRLAHDDRRAAVAAWLDALSLRSNGAKLPAHAFASAIDKDTALAPALPPLWSAEGVATIAEFDTLAEDEPARVAALRALYAHAFQRDRLEPAPPPDVDEELLDDPAIALVHSMALAQSPDERQRRDGREELRRALSREPGGWREGWRRVALGRSLIAEEDPLVRRQGVLELLRVPASGLADTDLRALALSEAAAEMARQGEPDAAAILRLELDALRRGARSTDAGGVS